MLLLHDTDRLIAIAFHAPFVLRLLFTTIADQQLLAGFQVLGGHPVMVVMASDLILALSAITIVLGSSAVLLTEFGHGREQSTRVKS